MLYNIKYTYSYISRFIILNKLSFIYFSYFKNIPKINNLILFFFVQNLEDLQDSIIYNYFYFFKFFLGVRAYFYSFKPNYSYGKTSYNFYIRTGASKSYLYKIIKIILNDVLSVLDDEFYYFIFNNSYFCNLNINDMNIFREKKTNIGLFTLSGILTINLNISNKDILSHKLLLKSLKLYI